MLWGYANGIFPMAVSAHDPALHWFDPSHRGIFPVGDVHISRSMRRHLRHITWQATLNQDFAGTLAGCADRDETWINAPLVSLYTKLFRSGHACSLEVRDADGDLIGGVFGITIGGAFFGESMFSHRENASKAALILLSEHLRHCGFTLFDTQYPTTHLQSLGGQTISRATYRRRLARAIRIGADIRSRPLPSFQAVLQARTQTS
ncbi:leucyl/phenylalanyl-tRNA--protein transferase [Paracoccus aerodenitrificans]|uniref:leucyl/phenylalanyl-tRNA--protein transferase n=1 Tax=Paracoccus aerodenitrificans TaxID=3017781 RepID=UPI0022F08D9A|nr:leucyl/phenylalanyl-tRNA--protein transferase [Paracoccus aerodenitrificans]WBU65649.1 leucyl/phenylalanyl-tRNA--protein transferase [Paracoccus aerodenitrificans]